MSNPDQNSQNNANENETKPSEKNKPNALQIIGSVLAAGFGVQSSKNRARDFKQGSFISYVIAGLIFTALFIFTLYSLVRYILAQT